MEQSTHAEMERNNKKAASGGLQDHVVPFLKREVEVYKANCLNGLALDHDRAELPLANGIFSGGL